MIGLSSAAINGVDARNQYNAALPLFRAVQDKRGEAQCALSLGQIAYYIQDQYEEARRQYSGALPLFHATTSKPSSAAFRFRKVIWRWRYCSS